MKVRALAAALAVALVVGACASDRGSATRQPASGSGQQTASSEAGSATGLPSTSPAAAEAVPWVPTPASSAPPDAEGGDLLLTRPCQAANLFGALVPGGAGLGNQLSVVVLINTGSSPCSLAGNLQLASDQGSGTATPLPVDYGGTYFGDPGPPADLAPGQAAEAYLGTSNGCADGPGLHVVGLTVTLPAGGAVALHDGALDAGCPTISASPLGFDPGWYLRFLTATGPKGLAGHPGTQLTFPVTITSKAPVSIVFDPCPAYSENLVGPPYGSGSIVRYALNCSAAQPVPPLGSETFTMAFDLPDGWTGDGTLFWQLDQVQDSVQVPVHVG